MDTLLYVLGCLFSPTSFAEVSVFYFVWIFFFLLVNIVWDILTSQTEAFHLSHLKSKTSTTYAAATFASSFVVLLSTFQPQVANAVGDAVIPLILAGAVGVLHGLSELCPYKPPSKSD